MISLERHNPARRMHRYYRLTVERNLFGEWSLVREWGRIGQPSWRMIDLHATEQDAMPTSTQSSPLPHAVCY
jgi:predicted DNA-binding WGR domain protein